MVGGVTYGDGAVEFRWLKSAGQMFETDRRNHVVAGSRPAQQADPYDVRRCWVTAIGRIDVRPGDVVITAPLHGWRAA